MKKSLFGLLGLVWLMSTGCVYDPYGPYASYDDEVIYVDAYHHRAPHDYYYYPDVQVYYDPIRINYFWYDGGHWRNGRHLPGHIRLHGSHYRFRSDADRPYIIHDRVIRNYHGSRGGDRDRRDGDRRDGDRRDGDRRDGDRGGDNRGGGDRGGGDRGGGDRGGGDRGYMDKVPDVRRPPMSKTPSAPSRAPSGRIPDVKRSEGYKAPSSSPSRSGGSSGYKAPSSSPSHSGGGSKAPSKR